MMAAGRGEFFCSFLEGLRRHQTSLPPQAPGPASFHSSRTISEACREAEHGTREGRSRGRRRRDQKFINNSKEITHRKESHFCQVGSPAYQHNFFERLPTEILIKILSYLDAPSLLCISHVSKLLHQLSNDEVMWQKIYMSNFGSQMWNQTTVDNAVVNDAMQEVQDQLENQLSTQPAQHDVDQLEHLSLEQPVDKFVGHWKRLYFRTIAGREMNKWRKELKNISPYTGLPRQTVSVLRNLNISWELTLLDRWGFESHPRERRVFFFESSMIVYWSKCKALCYKHINKMQLHGVKREAPSTSKLRPQWQSLILELDTKSCDPQVIGNDKLVKLLHLSSGVLIGVWRGHPSISFITISLHFHRLVEKSLLGSPACPYSEVFNRPPSSSDPELGLHGYTVHFVLHNTRTEIMSGNSRNLVCRTGQIQGGLLELIVINRENHSQHRPLSGNVNFPWASNMLEGSVENCCIMTMTLLDEFQKPFWCVSSPISIGAAKEQGSSHYNGEPFVMEYSDNDGKVKMELEWLKEEKQFFLTSLTVYVPLLKVRQHFGQNY